MLPATSEGEAWVRLSVMFSSKDDPLSMPEVQQLGSLSLELSERERRLSVELAEATSPWSGYLTEIGALSWLWVFGAYEVFRRAKNRDGALAEHTTFRFLNDEISEIRIALAKREARFNSAVKHLPKHIWDNGFGWIYRDRRLHERQFFRTKFAERWVEAAYTLPHTQP